MLETLQMAGPLGSTGITPLRRYYGPIRHPLVFGRLPGIAGYTAYLAPAISRRDEEGFSSCSACPCHRAVASTPPRWTAVSVSVRLVILPSPFGCGLGPRGYSFSRPQCVHFCYRPVTRNLPQGGLVDRLRRFCFHRLRYPNYGALTFTPAGLSPAEHASLHWTHNRTCGIPCIRLSDKTSRLRPRHVAPKPGQTHEPEGLVEVREWIAAALASSGLVLEAQPPTQPHSRIVVERPIRRIDGAY